MKNKYILYNVPDYNVRRVISEGWSFYPHVGTIFMTASFH